MTPTPDFNDLTPPDELVQSLMAWDRTLSYTLAYRAGARHGWEQARQLWPEPITDRPPTEEDGDDMEQVQVLTGEQWACWHWNRATEFPWLHTPRWQPRQPSLQEQALKVLDGWIGKPPAVTLGEAEIGLIRRALEQAGEGQA